MSFVLLRRNNRQLEIHQAIVSNVSHQVRSAAHRQRDGLRCDRQSNRLLTGTRRRIEEIKHGLPYLIASISVSDKINLALAMLEDTAFQNLALRLLFALQQSPVRAADKESLHTRSRAPVQVAY